MDDVAVILAHELVHAHDVGDSTPRLGISREDWAFLVDTLPATVGDGVVLLGEDRAFRVEFQVADLLGVVFPTVDEAHALLDDPSTPLWQQEIAGEPLLREKGIGSVDWLEQIADTYMHR